MRSAPVPFAIANDCAYLVQVSAILIGGSNASDFVFQGPQGAGIIALGRTQAGSLSFAPLAKGRRSASLQFTSDAPSLPLALSGEGL